MKQKNDSLDPEQIVERVDFPSSILLYAFMADEQWYGDAGANVTRPHLLVLSY